MTHSSDALPSFDLSSLLAQGLAGAGRGAALISLGSQSRFVWANAAFCEMMGRPAGAFDGTVAQGAMEALWAGNQEGLAGAMRGEAPVSARVVRPTGEALEARLEAFEGPQERYAMAWLDRIDDYAAVCEQLSAARKQIATGLAFDEKTGLLGSKAFWKAVGAQWSLCSRHELPVSFAMVVVRPSGGQEPDADFEEAAKASFGKSVRRASDLIARLSTNSFGVFTAGQEAEAFEERMRLFAAHLSDGFKASVGVCSMVPKQGSTPQVIKALSKRAVDKAFLASGSGSAIEFYRE